MAFENLNLFLIKCLFIFQIELFINKLPKLSSSFHYLCVFGESKPIEAEITKNGLLCNTPHIFSRPVIPHKKGI